MASEPGVIFFGPRDAPKAVRWWAERGMLHYEDERTNERGTVSVRDFLLRLQAVNEMIAQGRRSETRGMMHHDEVERHMRFVEQAVALAKKAKSQGDPYDPRVRKQKSREAKTSRIILPPGFSMSD